MAEVNMDAVDKEIVKKYVKKFGLKGRSLQDKVNALSEYFDSKSDELTIAECSICNGASDAELDECPFCGDADPVDGLEEAAEEVEEEVAEEEPEESEEPVEASKPKKTSKATKGKKKATKAPPEPEEDEPEVSIVDEAPKTAKPARKRSAAGKSKVVPIRPPQDEEDEELGIEKADAEDFDTDDDAAIVSKATIEDYEKQVARIKRSGKLVAKEVMTIGQALRKIDEDKLWQLPKGKGRIRKYRSFKACCKEEFGLSAKYAYELMRIADVFEEKDVAKFGVSKLRVMLNLPKEDRDEVLEGSKDLDDATTGSASDDADKGPKEKAKITALIVPDDVTEAIGQVRSKKRHAVLGEPTKPATTLKQEPWAGFQLENNTVLYVRTYKNEDGHVVFGVQFKRGQLPSIADAAE